MANDNIMKELADKLNNHESAVNSNMWSSISSQIGATAGVSATGAAAFGIGKIAALVMGVTVVGASAYFGLRSTDITSKENTPIVNNEVVVEVQKEEANNIAEMTVESKIPSIKQSPIKEKEVVVSSQTESPKIIKEEIDEVAELITPKAPEAILTIKEKKISRIVMKPIDDKRMEGNQPHVTDVITEESKTADKETFNILNKPNIFTPNNDGANDYFQLKSSGLSDYSLVIVTKENVKVWQSEIPNESWDGRDFSGVKVPNGNYIYMLTAEGPNGEKVSMFEALSIQY